MLRFVVVESESVVRGCLLFALFRALRFLVMMDMFWEELLDVAVVVLQKSNRRRVVLIYRECPPQMRQHESGSREKNGVGQLHLFFSCVDDDSTGSTGV